MFFNWKVNSKTPTTEPITPLGQIVAHLYNSEQCLKGKDYQGAYSAARSADKIRCYQMAHLDYIAPQYAAKIDYALIKSILENPQYHPCSWKNLRYPFSWIINLAQQAIATFTRIRNTENACTVALYIALYCCDHSKKFTGNTAAGIATTFLDSFPEIIKNGDQPFSLEYWEAKLRCAQISDNPADLPKAEQGLLFCQQITGHTVKARSTDNDAGSSSSHSYNTRDNGAGLGF
jgi:hypothetical protein